MVVHHDNLRAVMKRADQIDIAEGLVAYRRYRTMMGRLALHYGYPLPNVVAAFVSLSPNSDYMGNLRSTATLLWGARNGIPLENLSVTSYRACARRAWLYIDGLDFLSHAKGPKIRAFYQNIMDPSDPTPVTVDGHMASIWCGKRMKMIEAVRAKWSYNEIAQALRDVAPEYLILPNQLQAILWFTWKRIHNIKVNHQLHLFKGDDQWMQDLMPEEILTFPRRFMGTHQFSLPLSSGGPSSSPIESSLWDSDA